MEVILKVLNEMLDRDDISMVTFFINLKEDNVSISAYKNDGAIVEVEEDI